MELIAIRATVVLLALLLAACADPAGPGSPGAGAPTDATASPDPDGAPAASIAGCDALPDAGGLVLGPTAPPEPGVIPTPAVQVAHEQIEALGRWAQTEHADTYGGMWITGEALVIAFTEGADARRPEVGARFTDAPVHVVEVTHSEEALYRYQRQVTGLLQGQDRTADGWISSVGIRTNLNRVSVGVVGDGTMLRDGLVAAAPADAMCLEVEPIPGVDDAVTSPWSLPPGTQPDPRATSVEVWVHEQACASGQPADGRVVVQDLDVTGSDVTVTLGIIPVAGGAGCPSNPPTPFTVELPEPLSDRQLIDGSTGSPPSLPDGGPTIQPTEPPGPQPVGTVTPSPEAS
ncbi:hypothetical protein BH23ACT9_BH23ACT9_10260 [soil metagenome]